MNKTLRLMLISLIYAVMVLVIACSSQSNTQTTTPSQSTPSTPLSTPEPPKATPSSTPEPPKPTIPPTPKEVELKYDDGTAREFLAAGGGYLIDFSPPATPFTIKKIKVNAGLAGKGYEGKNFKLEIWDNDQKVIYSETYPVTKFAKIPPPPPAVEFEIPDIEINGKFYVHVFTGTERLEGIHMGADDSVENKHSEHTIVTVTDVVKIRPDWPYPPSQWFGDKNKVNWMIRVVGTHQ